MTKLLKFLDFIFACVSLVNPKKWGPFTRAYSESKFDHDFTISWSQCGEDIVLKNVFSYKTNSGFYLDIGAHHPDRFSVTRALYQNGWHGVNVDANESLRAAFEKSRPRDHFIHGAVGKQDEYTFYIADEPAVSTSNIDWKEKFNKGGYRYSSPISVPGMSIYAIIMKFGRRPDLLNIDIEGSDLDALESLRLDSLNRSLWPTWIMVESEPPVEKAFKSPCALHLAEYGFEIWLVLPTVTLFRNGADQSE